MPANVMATHNRSVAAAKSTIDHVFEDTGVHRKVTRESLQELREHIDGLLDALDHPDRGKGSNFE